MRAAWQAVPSVRACAGRVNGPLLNTAMQIMVAMESLPSRVHVLDTLPLSRTVKMILPILKASMTGPTGVQCGLYGGICTAATCKGLRRCNLRFRDRQELPGFQGARSCQQLVSISHSDASFLMAQWRKIPLSLLSTSVATMIVPRRSDCKLLLPFAVCCRIAFALTTRVHWYPVPCCLAVTRGMSRHSAVAASMRRAASVHVVLLAQHKYGITSLLRASQATRLTRH